MHIETYSEKYYLDVVHLASNCHEESLKEFDDMFDAGAVVNMIKMLKEKNTHNTFLLIDEGTCEGLLCGMEVESRFNNKKIWQDILWYVNKNHRRHGIKLLVQAEETLRSLGFDKIVMASLNNEMGHKMARLYEKMGYNKLEQHFIKGL